MRVEQVRYLPERRERNKCQKRQSEIVVQLGVQHNGRVRVSERGGGEGRCVFVLPERREERKKENIAKKRQSANVRRKFLVSLASLLSICD